MSTLRTFVSLIPIVIGTNINETIYSNQQTMRQLSHMPIFHYDEQKMMEQAHALNAAMNEVMKVKIETDIEAALPQDPDAEANADELYDLNAKIKQLKADLRTTNDNRANIQKTLEKLQIFYAELKWDKNSLQKDFDEVSRQLKDLEAKLVAANKESKNLEAQFKESKDLEAKLDAANKDSKELEAELKASEEFAKAQKIELDSQIGANGALQTELDETKSTLKDSQSALNTANEELITTKNDLVAANAALAVKDCQLLGIRNDAAAFTQMYTVSDKCIDSFGDGLMYTCEGTVLNRVTWTADTSCTGSSSLPDPLFGYECRNVCGASDLF